MKRQLNLLLAVSVLACVTVLDSFDTKTAKGGGYIEPKSVRVQRVTDVTVPDVGNGGVVIKPLSTVGVDAVEKQLVSTEFNMNEDGSLTSRSGGIREKKYYDVPLSTELQDYLFLQCEKFDVDPELALAVMQVESDFTPYIISEGGDYGLMQINSVNHSWLSERFGFTDYLDPYQNIRAGVFMLSEALRYGDNYHTSLMVYNCGLGRASELWSEGVYSTRYSWAVMNAYAFYNN